MVHVEARGDARLSRSGAFKVVPGVRGDSPGVHKANRVEHRTAVLVQDDVIADGVTDDLKTDTLRFESSRIGSVVIALDCCRIHEVQLDEAYPPLTDNGFVGFSQIVLCAGACGVQRIKTVGALVPDIADRNGLAFSVVNEPIFMVLVDPGSGGNLERRSPKAKGQAVRNDAVPYEAHAIRELHRVCHGELSARILIAFID